jgi:hypothetical protein
MTKKQEAEQKRTELIERLRRGQPNGPIPLYAIRSENWQRFRLFVIVDTHLDELTTPVAEVMDWRICGDGTKGYWISSTKGYENQMVRGIGKHLDLEIEYRAMH